MCLFFPVQNKIVETDFSFFFLPFPFMFSLLKDEWKPSLDLISSQEIVFENNPFINISTKDKARAA